mmetsp:Transcript_42358/g.68695  ORF Transcript_42358/g.68695 Transcript_42358/m.68695 type:complete len:853 (-) Transcript_42358:480-3038(-)|eukprot:CAMPEP_0184650308 /NCGR_PEP_ID=MMETSP0308-20130426/7831_1 /TAXON_ID=38269 /ORGANISM="Gloeochaete witrockiana, Strain SAG 46.84" /LENGTH=852 /DNA_ID=CAMNT_0027083743 /DNA_START=124 /DNA_END=2682 /DNA_ORIENTATION=-
MISDIEVPQFSPDQKINVLVVDDQGVDRMVVENLLRKCNCQCKVTLADSGRRALEILDDASNKFELILSDVYMPGQVGGMDLLESIKRSAAHRNTPVVMMSANDSKEFSEKFINAGAEEYIAKPIRMDKMQKLLYRIWKNKERQEINTPASDNLASGSVGGTPSISGTKGLADGDRASDEPTPINVLVVDDEKVDRLVVEKLLIKCSSSCKVTLAKNGHQALELLNEGTTKYDLVLSDVVMPGQFDGFELLQAIKRSAQLKDIPVIMMSANDGVGVSDMFVNAGASDYLAKPLRIGQVEEVLSKFSLSSKRPKSSAAVSQQQEKTGRSNLDVMFPLPSESIRVVGDYQLKSTICEGAFGKVKLATHLPTGKFVAIKIIKMDLITDVSARERTLREIEVMRSLDHPHIIKLIDVIDDPRLHISYVVMEYYGGGDLFNFIREVQRATENRACKMFRQLISAIEYLHERGIVHRDLKPENVLLDADGNVKVIDFGMSVQVGPQDMLKTVCGTPEFFAPEIIWGGEYQGPPADIWSCGVILFELVCGYNPFAFSNVSVVFSRILAGKYKVPDFVTPECASLICKILTTDPRRRMTIAQIKQDSWFLNPPPDPPVDKISHRGGAPPSSPQAAGILFNKPKVPSSVPTTTGGGPVVPSPSSSLLNSMSPLKSPHPPTTNNGHPVKLALAPALPYPPKFPSSSPLALLPKPAKPSQLSSPGHHSTLQQQSSAANPVMPPPSPIPLSTTRPRPLTSSSSSSPLLASTLAQTRIVQAAPSTSGSSLYGLSSAGSSSSSSSSSSSCSSSCSVSSSPNKSMVSELLKPLKPSEHFSLPTLPKLGSDAVMDMCSLNSVSPMTRR